MTKIKKAGIGLAISAGSFGAGQATAPTEVYVKAPLNAANYEQIVEWACEDLERKTYLVRCKEDGREGID